MEKFYGIKLMGNGFDNSITEKTSVKGSDSLSKVTNEIKRKYRYEDAKPRFGVIKILQMEGKQIKSSTPYTSDGKKFEAFIFKFEGEKIDSNNHRYTIDGTEIDFDFERYNVHIIKV